MPPPHFLRDEKKTKRTIPNKVLWKWIFGYLREHKRSFILLTLSMFVFTTFQAILPYLQGQLIDNMRIGSENGIVAEQIRKALLILSMDSHTALI